jgi:hypothetical protein
MWFQIKEAFKYYLFSRHKKGHAIHSPFVFGLITEVFLDKTDYPEYKIIEQRIKLLKKSKHRFLPVMVPNPQHESFGKNKINS